MRERIQQDLEICVEQVAPARHEMTEQRILVRRQKVMAGVELMGLGEFKIRAQQVGHRTIAEPLAVQLPFTAWGDQPIRDQYLQDLVPSRSFAARRQPVGSKAVHLQLTPQLSRQPAGAPLPWPA